MKILMAPISHLEKRANWQPLSVVDGRLATGQNPHPRALQFLAV